MKKESIHLSGINGLRAIAALSVLWGHCMHSFGNWGIPEWKFPLAFDGVTLFFVISGFLITFLLIHEKDDSSDVSVPKFYMRRILRIWPLYFGYILVTVLCLFLVGRESEIVSPALWYYCLFAANIPMVASAGLIPIVHYWSLGVEEQYYLFWPWLVKFGRSNILKIAVRICLFWLMCKWGVYMVWGKCWVYRFFSVTRFDCMMLGAIGAILYYRGNNRFVDILSNRLVSFSAWMLLALSCLYEKYIPSPVRSQFFAVVSLALIYSQVASEKPIINLEKGFFDFIGKISYGIYVIHPLVILLCSPVYSGLHLSIPLVCQYILIYGGITVITILTAWISYTYLEKPFLRIKKRYMVVASQSSMS